MTVAKVSHLLDPFVECMEQRVAEGTAKKFKRINIISTAIPERIDSRFAATMTLISILLLSLARNACQLRSHYARNQMFNWRVPRDLLR